MLIMIVSVVRVTHGMLSRGLFICIGMRGAGHNMRKGRRIKDKASNVNIRVPPFITHTV